MNFKLAAASFLISFALSTAALFSGSVWADMQLPRPGKINADAKAVKDLGTFYEEIEKALRSKDIDKIMSFYAKDYLHHGITKKQLRFMWLEIFTKFEELYSVHVFSKIEVHGSDAILICTGALFGVENKGDDYQTVDRWVIQPHWLTRVDGEWKIIGGATHQAERGKGKLALHPLF